MSVSALRAWVDCEREIYNAPRNRLQELRTGRFDVGQCERTERFDLRFVIEFHCCCRQEDWMASVVRASYESGFTLSSEPVKCTTSVG